MKGRINIRNLREIPDGDRGMYSSVTWPCIEFLDVLRGREVTWRLIWIARPTASIRRT